MGKEGRVFLGEEGKVCVCSDVSTSSSLPRLEVKPHNEQWKRIPYIIKHARKESARSKTSRKEKQEKRRGGEKNLSFVLSLTIMYASKLKLPPPPTKKVF